MNENKYLKIFSLAAFVALATVSCWATAESLHLLLDSWPLAMCWIVTICFFVMASWGTKLIWDSFDKHIYLENRGGKLVLGIFLLVIFWLLCSMPTNTHTFFYRTVAKDVLTSDILTTKSYLKDISLNKKSQVDYNTQVEKISNDIHQKLVALEHEIDNPNSLGDGPETKAILYEISQILNTKPIKPLSGVARSPKERAARKAAYREMVLDQLNTYIANLAQSANQKQSVDIKLAKQSFNELSQVENAVIEMKNEGGFDNDIIMQADVCLQKAYSIVKNNKGFVNFQGTDEQIYSEEPLTTKTHKLLSVYDVWKDWLSTDKYNGKGFIFWVLLSILVDIAAFIFFDFAFKKREY